jgi:DNA repair ATPase RecN
MKFSGKNFQGWGEFNLEVNGLTVLTGPSDAGKSAIFRALRGIFYNELSEAFVREGQDQLELTVDIDGHKIYAVRGIDESAKYVIGNGQCDACGKAECKFCKKFSKLGGRRPQELKDLGFNSIRIGDTELDPIFAQQNDTQFLIQGVSPTELNNILGGFASTEKLEYGKREANLRITQKNQEAKTLAGEVHDSQTRQAAFEEKITLVTPLFSRVESLEPLIAAAEGKLIVITEVIQHIDELRPLKEILDRLEIPDLQDTDNTALQVSYLTIALNALRNKDLLLRAQKSIDENLKLWQEVKRLYYGMEASRELSNLHEEIKLQKKLGQYLNKILDNADLTAVVNLIDGIKLVNVASDLQRELVLSREFEVKLSTELTAAQAEEHAKQHEIEAVKLKKNLVICPECGAKF